VLSEIQFPSLTAQSYLEDSLLYASSNADLEVWNVADPAQPVKRGVLPAPVGDFWIRDTFLFYIRSDTFHVISIASPTNLYELGSCAESGSATTGSGNTVVVVQNGRFALVDVSDPASPHEVGSYPCGWALSATARGNLVCASYEETSDPYPTRFITLDISTPSSPHLLARVNDLGGYDIFLDGPLAFVSGGDPGSENSAPFQILSIADSAHPAFIDSCRTTDRYPWGVWESYSLNRVLVADEYDGLAVVDISNLNNPVLDTSVMVAATAEDVFVDGLHCYVADGMAGLAILDVSDPTRPTQVSGLDTTYGAALSYAVVARDSMLYWGWYYPYFRTVDVTDPTRPLVVGSCFPPDAEPKDMVLQDSFVYAAMDNQFYVINVARPRQPQAVGWCALPDRSYGMCLRDSLAYVSTYPLAIINTANPSQPETVGSIPRGTWSVFVKDTLAYLAAVGLHVWNVANPSAPTPVDSLTFGHMVYDVVVVDSLAYLACSDGLRLANVADPHNMRVIALHRLPCIGWRLVHDSPCVYVATHDAGVCIFETTAVGIAEPRQVKGEQVRKEASVVRGVLNLEVGSRQNAAYRAELLDVSGRKVLDLHPGANDVRALAPGVYFVREAQAQAQAVRKVIKLN
jgi:hypothetical protein